MGTGLRLVELGKAAGKGGAEKRQRSKEAEVKHGGGGGSGEDGRGEKERGGEIEEGGGVSSADGGDGRGERGVEGRRGSVGPGGGWNVEEEKRQEEGGQRQRVRKWEAGGRRSGMPAEGGEDENGCEGENDAPAGDAGKVEHAANSGEQRRAECGGERKRFGLPQRETEEAKRNESCGGKGGERNESAVQGCEKRFHGRTNPAPMRQRESLAPSVGATQTRSEETSMRASAPGGRREGGTGAVISWPPGELQSWEATRRPFTETRTVNGPNSRRKRGMISKRMRTSQGPAGRDLI
jgi:hypothetical protein